MFTGPTASTKGILRPADVARQVDVRRYGADDDVAGYVERYWSVHWDRPARDQYAVRVIPPPSINLTFTHDGGAHLHGVGRQLSAHELSGSGWVFGLKFRPGGFHALAGLAASEITDQTVPLEQVMGPAVPSLADAVLNAESDRHRRALVAAFVRRQRPERDDEMLALVVRIVATMLADRNLTRVDDVTARFGLSSRTAQRLFRRYVGVGPKHVLQRCRLHDGADLLANGTVDDISALAAQLGYVDQAHFTRDFSAVVGSSPAAYLRACRADAARPADATVAAQQPR
ncbi:AraC-like DNA-binding protein [Haloactinopolyspora alba]|uniref:AraC-like DNA-binding protein n=1 Tax=Haloactinopolyspora alba TaxID=648780 RepID=A0A2P8DRE0_9ACTN|nr:helix-turn-helix domain-containing protein [Haloactinopolyspora alba]PSK99781.1 AraC-like DNA-binding protein [Haloactinopolyspora alba]